MWIADKAFVCQHGVSQRRACAEVDGQITLRYESRLIKRDAPPVAAAMHELSASFCAAGYRRIQALLDRQEYAMKGDRAHRIWRQSGLQVPRKRPL